MCSFNCFTTNFYQQMISYTSSRNDILCFIKKWYLILQKEMIPYYLYHQIVQNNWYQQMIPDHYINKWHLIVNINKWFLTLGTHPLSVHVSLLESYTRKNCLSLAKVMLLLTETAQLPADGTTHVAVSRSRNTASTRTSAAVVLTVTNVLETWDALRSEKNGIKGFSRMCVKWHHNAQ